MGKRRGVARLRYFADCVEQLQASHDLSTMGSKLTITSGRAIPLEVKVETAEQHRFRSYLIDARRLFTKGEDTDLALILDEAPRYLPNDVARKAVTDAAEHFREVRTTGVPRVTINRAVLKPAEVADLLIQGTIFHGDATKELRLAELAGRDKWAEALILDQALWFVNRIVSVSVWVASVIKFEDAAGRLTKRAV